MVIQAASNRFGNRCRWPAVLAVLVAGALLAQPIRVGVVRDGAVLVGGAGWRRSVMGWKASR